MCLHFIRIWTTQQKLFHNTRMLRRLNLVLLMLMGYAVSGIADTHTSGWNCTQSADNEEWLCVTGPDQEGQPSETVINKAPVAAIPVIEQAAPVPVPGFGPYVKVTAPITTTPPRTVAETPGWTCAAEPDAEQWECRLIGPDFKGQARVVVSDDSSGRLAYSAFDIYQEQLFSMMQADLKADPWAGCQLPRASDLDFTPDTELRARSPLDVQADYSEIFDKEITTFFGNVEMTRADQIIKADRTTYDSVSQTMDAQGNVYYRDDGLSVFSDTGLIRLDSDQARLRDALFILPAESGRGSADVFYRDSSDILRFKDVTYTTCRPGNQDWAIHASRFKINRASGKASAKHAWLEFKGIPFLYSPYLSFPIDDRRTSGFFSPIFGSTDENGLDFSLPYYWNIAPNYDATLRPRGLSKRGFLLAGDFRYLTESSKGEVSAEYLPYDSERKEQRGQFGWENETNFFPGLRSVVDINYVSDDDYLDELGNSLSISDTRHVRSHADLSYNTRGVRFKTLFENYQTIDPDIRDVNKPYRRLPQITLDLDKLLKVGSVPLNLAWQNEFVFFHRSDGLVGQRLNLKPSVSVPFNAAGAFVTPKLSLQHTQYWLQDNAAGTPDSISRTLPIFSLDSGLFLDRAFHLAGSPYVQTIEPHLFYLYIPFDDQDDIPNFDTGANDFNLSQLFRENRFSGGDRVQDANQVSLVVTSRLIDSETGLERLMLNIGQIFYFRDREVFLPGDNVETGNYSDVIAGVSGQLTNALSFSSLAQWSSDSGNLVRGEAFLRYREQQKKIFNVGYRFREEDVFQGADAGSQSDVDFLWPIVDNWNLVGRWLYTFRDGLTLESFLGLENESCCWRFRILARRYVNNADSDPQTGIFVQLELKGLTGFGDKVERFIERNISGYRVPD